MESLSRYDKQAALQILTKECFAMRPTSDTLEYGTRLLTMLYYTSNNPVNAPYTPGSIVADLDRQGTDLILWIMIHLLF